MNIQGTELQVLYNSKNITADVVRYALSVTYTDKTHGESDEIEIELEDVDARWLNGWYPEKGAKLTVSIGELKCGVFEIDEIEAKGPPDTVTIRGMATGIVNSLRTKKSDAHENKTLRQIAEKVAQKNGLTIAGEIPEITIGRATQNQETDLGFLKRIAGQFGIIFSVRESVITFTSVYGLEKRGESFVLDKTDLTSYTIKDKATGAVKSAKVRSKSAKGNEKVEADLEYKKWQEEEGYKYEDIENQDDAVTHVRVENKQQAEAVAKSVMHLSASNQQEGSITIKGNGLAVAGNNFTFTGIGKLSGKWNIKESTHKLDKSGGYTTDCEIKRLQTPTNIQRISKAKKKTKRPSSTTVENYTKMIYDPVNTGNIITFVPNTNPFNE